MIKKGLVDELLEISDDDKKIISSFQKRNELSPDIFNDENKMDNSVRKHLLAIANDFLDFVAIELFIHDIVLTGSLANYNWSEYSDVDLHIVIDMDELGTDDKIKTIVKDYFDSKKQLWNDAHNVTIKGYDVEIYVQDINEKHLSSGVYSILHNKWLVEPTNTKEDIDETKILEKAEEYIQKIDELVKKENNGNDVQSDVEKLRKKLKKFRQCGLDKGGEYSYENLTFKLLRRNGYIGKLLDLKKSLANKKLSVAQ
jgi:predicted nucleotidyltransferase